MLGRRYLFDRVISGTAPGRRVSSMKPLPGVVPLLTAMRNAVSLLTLAAFLVTVPLISAQEAGTAADNSKVNKRDRKSGAVTADQQKEREADREMSATIRKALMDNKDLSTYAHNVKIITRNGMVTLKGPVRSLEEKKAVEAKANEVAGTDKVKSMISIKPKS